MLLLLSVHPGPCWILFSLLPWKGGLADGHLSSITYPDLYVNMSFSEVTASEGRDHYREREREKRKDRWRNQGKADECTTQQGREEWRETEMETEEVGKERWKKC
jgi:hypothetical protein